MLTGREGQIPKVSRGKKAARLPTINSESNGTILSSPFSMSSSNGKLYVSLSPSYTNEYN
jgi:hypothetical protein